MFSAKSNAAPVFIALALLLASALPPSAPTPEPVRPSIFRSPKEPTPMRIQHWQQDHFRSPNQYLQKEKGDFYSLDAFIPARDGQRLERMPTWTGHIDFASNFVEPKGAFYDPDNPLDNYFVFVGTSEATSPQDTLGVMTISQSALTASGLSSVGDASTTDWLALSGLHKQNLLWYNTDFWVIPSSDECFKVAGYTGGSRTKVYNGDAVAILPARDTLYLVTDDDDIYRWDPDASAFELYYETWMDLDIQHVIPYRNDLLIFSKPTDGALTIHQLPDRPPADLRQLIRVPTESAQFVAPSANGTFGTPWVIHDDRIYFSPGIYWTDSNDAEVLPIWRFDGNSVELVENVEPPIVPNAWGLVQWRGRLLLYLVGSSAQYLYAYHGGRFVQVLDSAFTCAAWSDVYSLAGQLWMPYEDAGTQGWTHLEDFEDSVFISSWLDMGRPGVQKHLLSVAAVVSDAVEDFNVKLEYRTESGSWTTAANTDDARHIIGEDLGVDFYLLQLRVTLDDDTGDNEDIALESLGATYSYGR